MSSGARSQHAPTRWPARLSTLLRIYLGLSPQLLPVRLGDAQAQPLVVGLGGAAQHHEAYARHAALSRAVAAVRRFNDNVALWRHAPGLQRPWEFSRDDSQRCRR